MKAIVAVDRLWGIGKDGKLLFRIKEDMEFFKKMTTGKVVVMGKKTFDSLPNGEPLKDRINLVITSNKSYKSHDNVIFGNIDEINEEIKKYNTDDVFIIGGESIYKQFIHECDTVYVTHNYSVYDADTYMPNLAFEGFECSDNCIIDISTTDDYAFIKVWVKSKEIPPYKSVLWIKNPSNGVSSLFNNPEGWHSIAGSNPCTFTNTLNDNFKLLFSDVSKPDTVTKIHDYYKAEIIRAGNGYIIRVASFGKNADEAMQNLKIDITNILK